jgi:hypothetical protein
MHARTLNLRTYKPENGGLFCSSIFGPVKDYECLCGRYAQQRHLGMTCEYCGVEVAKAAVRRERFGHITLAAPCLNIWFLKRPPSRIGQLLRIRPQELLRVLHYDAFLVVDPGMTPLKRGMVLTERELKLDRLEYQDEFIAITGTPAIKRLLEDLDLDAEIDRCINNVGHCSERATRKLASQLRLLEDIKRLCIKPEWMALEVIPVLPPGLRPLNPTVSKRLKTPDLNDLYRQVINCNQRLIRLQQLQAPEIVLRTSKRRLQKAVDSLLQSSKTGRTESLSRRETPERLATVILKSAQELSSAQWPALGWQSGEWKRLSATARSEGATEPNLAPAQSARVAEESPDLALEMATLAGSRTADWRIGRAWLKRLPYASVAGLLPVAMFGHKEARDIATFGLMVVATDVPGAEVLERVASASGPRAKLAASQLFERASKGAPTTGGRTNRLPPTWLPSAHPRPVLTSSGKALPDEAVNAIAEAMMRSSRAIQHPLVEQARRVCTPESLSAFAWSLFEDVESRRHREEAWFHGDNAMARRLEWMRDGLSYFGSDSIVKPLGSFIRSWPRRNLNRRAERGMETLADIGSDSALIELASLTHFHRTAQAAKGIFQAVAIERGLTQDQLDDLLVPTFDLHTTGELQLELQPTVASISADEALTPRLRIGDGPFLVKWPKTLDAVDASALRGAKRHWTEFSRELKPVARLQALRLEKAMLDSRRWPVQEFLTRCVDHPLMRAAARGLVWGHLRPDRSDAVHYFGLSEELRSFEDVNGKTVALDEIGEVFIPHPIAMGPAPRVRIVVASIEPRNWG